MWFSFALGSRRYSRRHSGFQAVQEEADNTEYGLELALRVHLQGMVMSRKQPSPSYPDLLKIIGSGMSCSLLLVCLILQ